MRFAGLLLLAVAIVLGQERIWIEGTGAEAPHFGPYDSALHQEPGGPTVNAERGDGLAGSMIDFQGAAVAKAIANTSLVGVFTVTAPGYAVDPGYWQHAVGTAGSRRLVLTWAAGLPPKATGPLATALVRRLEGDSPMSACFSDTTGQNCTTLQGTVLALPSTVPATTPVLIADIT